MTKNTVPTVVNVYIREEGGIFYASSPQMRGLHVCGATAQAVLADIPNVLKQLYRLNYKKRVEIIEPAAIDFKPTSKAGVFDGLTNLLAIPEEALHTA